MSESSQAETGNADLLAAAGVALVALAVALVPGVPPAVGLVVGVPFVLLVPGYALVAAVFPRAGETTPRGEGSVSWASRLALSVGGSVVAVGAVSGALDFTVWGFARESVTVGLAAFTVLAATVARYRRARVPAGARVTVTAEAVGTRLRSIVVGDGVAGAALTVLVLAAAVGAAGVVAEEANSTAETTELFIVGSGPDDQPAAGAHPTNLTVGRPSDVTVGVGVSGPESLDGTVVGHLERVAVEGDTVRVTRQREVARFDVSVAPGDRSLVEHAVTPTRTGDRLRLTYRLYPDGTDRPIREAHVWVGVAPS
ncbi:hypothetical protein C475_13362 [Halosimplex carlsbadense 2-9-1]|uniref:DUF1616 domain-containing protein n=1 Tax=Halosimplex carlsbadense 2-9-1 TaxID=797114 RepID=M0CLT7_9EURY|nr:DUF1616 domain-containing protein [Halosimplex carlsbadense]ELZ24240.1 hypothetical protein C475_13362 [Halosimplex carlsbadense 2-9-1]